MPIWKINFCSSVLLLSEVPKFGKGRKLPCRISREIKVFGDWFGCVLVIRCREGVLGIGHLVVCIHMIAHIDGSIIYSTT